MRQGKGDKLKQVSTLALELGGLFFWKLVAALKDIFLKHTVVYYSNRGLLYMGLDRDDISSSWS
jgi:hypothetical protein